VKNSNHWRDSILVFLVFPVFHADLDKKNRKNKYLKATIATRNWGLVP